MLCNSEFSEEQPPAGHLMDRIELVSSAAPSFVLRNRRSPQLQEDIERQADELLKRAYS